MLAIGSVEARIAETKKLDFILSEDFQVCMSYFWNQALAAHRSFDHMN